MPTIAGATCRWWWWPRTSASTARRPRSAPPPGCRSHSTWPGWTRRPRRFATVTDAVRASAAASGDEEVTRLLPEIFDSVADGVTVLDRAGTLRYANAAAARLMGFGSSAEIVGRGSEALVGRFELLDDDGQLLDP